MTDKAKRQFAVVLVFVALALGVGAAAAWNVGEGKDPNPYNEAFGLPPDPPKKEADHVLSFVMLAGAGVSLICAAILGATAKPDESDPGSDGESKEHF